MDQSIRRVESRRRFLRFLAGSPLFGYLWAGALLHGPSRASGVSQGEDLLGHAAPAGLISGPDEALNVFDFDAVARSKLPPAHYGYLATGVDDDATLRANRQGFSRLRIRARRLVDVSRVDMTTELLGTTWPTPVLLAPVGSQRAFHSDGELAVARAARSRDHLQILSTVSTTSVEDVTEQRGAPVWYQLYPTTSWEVARALLRRAEAAGCPVVVLTVDLPVSSNREAQDRMRGADPRDCGSCHEPGLAGMLRRKPMFDGLDRSKIDGFFQPQLTWEFVRRLRDDTRMKIVLKGIVTREDAVLCVKHGVDGIIVSNHGGRAEESGRPTIESLPEVVEAVGGRIPVVVDGGIRRGTDIFKALALGATAVGIGRPYLWGLAGFGQPGVEKVLDLLQAELQTTMQLAGTPTLRQIGPAAVTAEPCDCAESPATSR